MNIFLYDEITDKYKKKIKRVEEELNRLSLQGKIIYLKNVKNLKESLLEEINNGAKTIISVGNNKTVNNIVNILANISDNIPISLIPIGPNNSIAESLGIKNEKNACFILSSRRIENLNVCQANESFFIEQATIKAQGSRIYIDNNFKISSDRKGEIFIYNIAPNNYPKKDLVNPKNKTLHIYIKTGLKNETHISGKTIEVKNETEELILDGAINISSPIKINVTKKSIPFIVGKLRSFNTL
ncbi:MAG: diacylglycerol kinase family protein [Patescibacteria group bacterium]|jgi:hypothetical protein